MTPDIKTLAVVSGRPSVKGLCTWFEAMVLSTTIGETSGALNTPRIGALTVGPGDASWREWCTSFEAMSLPVAVGSVCRELGSVKGVDGGPTPRGV